MSVWLTDEDEEPPAGTVVTSQKGVVYVRGSRPKPWMDGKTEDKDWETIAGPFYGPVRITVPAP